MDCLQAGERLPWYLNGTLEGEELEEVRLHLEACAGCRDELDATRRAASVFGAHLPASVLADLAWGRGPSDADADVARRHLAACPSCADELALARESRAEESELRPPARAPRAAWGASLAAALVVGLAGGYLWNQGRLQRRDAASQNELRRMSDALAQATSDAEDLRRRQAALESRNERLSAPQANLPVVEVFPGLAQQRSSGGPPPNEIALSTDSAFVALVLNSASRAGAMQAELRAPDGAVLWKASGLQPSPLGAYTLGLPAERLPEGTLSLVLSREDGRGAPEQYRLRVRRTR
jgi:Putative zinc-finger